VTRPPYLDTLGLWEAAAALPEQIITALDDSAQVLADARLPVPGTIRNVAVFGMGASGLAGQAAAALASPHSPVPVWVGEGYDVPAFVSAHTLAFVVSHSGRTEETRAAADEVLDRGAHVMVVSGPGPLAQESASGPTVFDVPAATLTSRTALGATTVPVLMTLAALGLHPDVATTLRAAVPALARRRDALVATGGPADQVAQRIGRTIPLVYGSTGFAAVAARRWKAQVNLNAKTPAFFAVQPGVSHDEVAGWGQHGDVTRQVLTLVMLRHAGEHPHTARRFELVARATDEVMADLVEVWAEGDDDLSRFFDLALYGDLVSLHVAGREGIDPGPVPATSDVEAGLS
jgi:glucose/mannose-6-phosphate isomerase